MIYKVLSSRLKQGCQVKRLVRKTLVFEKVSLTMSFQLYPTIPINARDSDGRSSEGAGKSSEGDFQGPQRELKEPQKKLRGLVGAWW